MSEREKKCNHEENFKVDVKPEIIQMFAKSKLIMSKYSNKFHIP